MKTKRSEMKNKVECPECGWNGLRTEAVFEDCHVCPQCMFVNEYIPVRDAREVPEKTKLPDKLWELIIVALADEAKAHRSPRYFVDMYKWHQPDREQCKVCLAGSVMAFSLSAPIHKSCCPEDFDETTKLDALDSVRDYCVVAALEEFYYQDWISTQGHKLYAFEDQMRENFPDYEDDRLEWRRGMRKIAAKLKKMDL